MASWTRIATLALSSILVAAPASGADQRTGSHLDSGTARPVAMHLNPPTALDRVLKLIQAGQNREAVDVARRHVESLRDVYVFDETRLPGPLYFALNALCVALTTSNQISEALAACDEAIALAPQRWTAWNSRGTAHFVAADFASALADFERARALAPIGTAAVETVERNISLARQRLGAE